MNLRLWNSAGVARDLAAGLISEPESYAYFVASSVLLLVQGYISSVFGAEVDWLVLYELFVALAITIVGLRACYLINGGKTGKEFLLRFICISVPVGVKLALAYVALLVLLYRYPNPFLDPFVFLDEDKAWALFSLLWIAAFTGIFYWRVWYHMRSVQAHATQQTVPADVLASRGRG